MDIHSVRQMLRSRSVYEIPLRVTYYARGFHPEKRRLDLCTRVYR